MPVKRVRLITFWCTSVGHEVYSFLSIPNPWRTSVEHISITLPTTFLNQNIYINSCLNTKYQKFRKKKNSYIVTPKYRIKVNEKDYEYPKRLARPFWYGEDVFCCRVQLDEKNRSLIWYCFLSPNWRCHSSQINAVSIDTFRGRILRWIILDVFAAVFPFSWYFFNLLPSFLTL